MAYMLDAKADMTGDGWVPITEADTIGDLGDPAERLLNTEVATELRVAPGHRGELTADQQQARERIVALVKHRENGGDL